ncbi:DUF433 domain-containing protein [Acetobacter lambici]|uniref:DUF433 domain-containing protein n=1 Tax=Acetobacter lambici TaxID=1332824 RepID=A0ABT1F167_9PROT|nr:DUF433 domain-containing protein [Acetobacter lambici]MCP1242760.1 DUF433 domain-containing protein [Acetobacter lambici]MCP1258930.1 DUF433 domain-containing protein [Acetobacter lambici]NHO57892.1 DUF433 domain-containing protein [Acetobacter lambici]
MGERADLLRSSEAAFVSGIAVHSVNRAIDDHVLPKGFFEVEGGRRLTPGACVMIAFYHGTAEDFTAPLRKHILARFEDRLRFVEFSHYHTLAQENWKLVEHYWSVDLAPFIERTVCSYERLREAEAVVSRDEEVMGGAEVLHGTRVLVHDVAAAVSSGETLDRIRDAYPSLTDRQIELASIYAIAHPQRGRPRMTLLPIGTERIDRKVVPRKTAG